MHNIIIVHDSTLSIVLPLMLRPRVILLPRGFQTKSTTKSRVLFWRIETFEYLAYRVQGGPRE